MITARLLFGLVNSIVEWYRPDRRANAAPLADAVCALAFDGLRARRPEQAVSSGSRSAGPARPAGAGPG
jgi:hypothetical protein